MRLPWKTGSNSFDEDLGEKVLAFARENPNTEKDLEQSLELRGATYAILESLPRKARKHVTHDVKVDIASVIVLQRAAATEAALKNPEAILEYQEAVSQHSVSDSPDTGGAEEA